MRSNLTLKNRLNLFWFHFTYYIVNALLRTFLALGPLLILVAFPLWLTDCPIFTGDWEDLERIKNGEPMQCGGECITTHPHQQRKETEK